MIEYSQLAYYKFFYDMKIFDENVIYVATTNRILTRAEYKIIVGKDYVEPVY